MKPVAPSFAVLRDEIENWRLYIKTDSGNYSALATVV